MFHQSPGDLPSGSVRRRRAAKQSTRRLQFESLEPRQLLAGNVAIDPTRPLGVISPDLIGTNVIYSRESDALWNDGRVAASLKALRTGFMRYPGGEVTSFYHWNRNTGVPFKDAWDSPIPAQPGSQWMSLDEYMRQVNLAGATPLVGINIQSGHNHGRVAEGVAEAVALVRYAQSKGYGVEHYFIDNEQYASNANMSATQYANYVNLYASAIRQVDPNVKIVVNWQSFVNDGWKTILKIAGPNIDYVDFHAYWNRDGASFENWRGQRLMTHAGETYFNKIQSFRQEIARQGLDAKVAAFEWNLGPAKWYARPSPFQAALMNSEAFMQFVWAKLDAAAFWPLHYDANAREAEDDRSLLTAGELEQSAVYQMLSMYKELLGKQLVSVRFAGAGVLATAGHQPANDTTTVMLLEKTGRTTDLRISLGSFLKQPGSYQVQAQTFRAAGGDLQADRGEIVSIPFVLDRRSGEIRLAVGGYTLTKLTIRHLAPVSAPPQVKPPAAPVSPPRPPQTAPTVTVPNAITPSVQQAAPSGGVTQSGRVPETTVPPAAAPIAKPPAQAYSPPLLSVPLPERQDSSSEAAHPKNTTSAPPTVITVSIAERIQTINDQLRQGLPITVDELFGAMETEVVLDDSDSEAASLAALLAFVPDEVIAQRRRRGLDAFAAGLPPDDEMTRRF